MNYTTHLIFKWIIEGRQTPDHKGYNLQEILNEIGNILNLSEPNNTQKATFVAWYWPQPIGDLTCNIVAELVNFEKLYNLIQDVIKYHNLDEVCFYLHKTILSKTWYNLKAIEEGVN